MTVTGWGVDLICKFVSDFHSTSTSSFLQAMISLSARGFSTTQLAEEVEQFLGKIRGLRVSEANKNSASKSTYQGLPSDQFLGWFVRVAYFF